MTTRIWGEGVQFSKIAIAQIGSPSQKNFRNGEIDDFFEKNDWIVVQLNRWFEESDLDVEELAESVVKAIEDWLDEDTVEFEPDEGGISEGQETGLLYDVSPHPIISNEKKFRKWPIAQKCD